MLSVMGAPLAAVPLRATGDEAGTLVLLPRPHRGYQDNPQWLALDCPGPH